MRRKILITGATSGIGLALATRLAPRHEILATGRALKKDAEKILPANAGYIRVPQSDPLVASATIREGLRDVGWTGFHNAILVAGTGYVCEAQSEDPVRLRETLDVNLAATILIARACLPLLEKTNGRLTLIGSTAARGSSHIASYCASKAGLAGFARSLRSEWRGRVSVQILHPGPVATPMHEKAGYVPGRLGALFLSPSTMAAMLEFAVARGRSPRTLSWFRYIGGESIFGRRL